ncbi:MAG: mannose-1-phosphate guanylyltransferase/mannose-6-phosphate isomerase [Chromatiaceae bacterium]|nr:mannose-1-phosphate guanylyltransferase/mannose-6-phosphate isomerase [Gammaproteobacteria bacterium]MCP5426801.1 mannose-1-phosphate guanylyltransferase/mannose-6-phosphate isomerase [Chromatiaceae bacterium]MCB1861527.1 mannose-1-phosphate guanylyltransferase/mannose-6-phosphate isomerase [Gammaproteobacteria bacterium]MCB1872108.1 mannose-1-phosphate guanylyltransferase/mannose-6-phosphate isomerase [Gammaproteobacteria bacterium]MCB1881149.1 mannose-1-phosphate guanylyltransferase/mannos
MQLLPVILSGGSGSRLWPLSREAYPKQFLPLLGSRSLLQATVQRIDGMNGAISLVDPLIVCNETHRFLVAEQFRFMQRDATAIMLEPTGRNTAPALALAALMALRSGEDPVLLVMPADHLINQEAVFRQVVSVGAQLADRQNVVTFGIVPTGPETGYGYIRKGAPLADEGSACRLDAFVEKPDLNTAREYLESGSYLWNSGLFMLKASLWLELLKKYRPDIAAACQHAFEQGSWDGSFFRPDAELFSACPSDSIDYAVMEKLSEAVDEAPVKAVVLPLDAGWSDVGAWSALWDVSEHDAAGNASEGDVFAHDATDNLLIAKHRMLAAVGVSNLIVVETPDAVLVLDKEKAQEVKAVTQYLKDAARDEHVFHKRVHRPWGNYEPIDEGTRFQVKRLTVNPGGCLSLQMHHHRAEHWIVVSGTARVTRGEETLLLTENQSTYIPLGTQHRLENPGRIPLEIIEVQSGSYLGEDDIQRFEDIYNRNSDD